MNTLRHLVDRISEINAGGPGSGRKPKFLHHDEEKLNSLHQGLTKQGFKYKYSSGDKKQITHIYHKSNPYLPAGRESAYIWERSNGDHAASR